MPRPGVTAERPSPTRWRRAAVAAVLGVLVAAGGVAAWHTARVRADRTEGLELAAAHQFDRAEPLLRRAHDRDPGDAEVVRALALGYLDARRYAEADPLLDRWCELRPGDSEPFRRRFELSMRRQKVDEALADAERILKLDPGNVPVRQLLLQHLVLVGRYEDAEREGIAYLKARPNTPEVVFLLIKNKHNQGHTAEAAGLLDRFLAVTPDFPGGLELRAEMHLAAGEPEAAVSLLRRAADRPGRDPTAALYQLSVALTRAGREDEAKKVLADMQCRRAMGLWETDEHRDTSPALQARVVEALEVAGRADEAVHFLTGILDRNPGAAGTRRLLADCYDKLGRPAEAAEQRRRAGATP